MSSITALTFLFDSLMLALASAFLMIVLWHDSHKPVIRHFATFLIWVILWNIGSLLLRLNQLLWGSEVVLGWVVGLVELGFAGASIATWSMVTVIIGVYDKRAKAGVLASLFLVIVYRLFLIVNLDNPIAVDLNRVLVYQLQPLLIIVYLLFDGMTLLLIWRFSRKLPSKGFLVGIIVFLFGQSLIFLNPELVISAFSTTVSFAGVWIVSVLVVRQEIIKPLSERLSQVEAMHKVSLAVTSQIALDTVLDEIVMQASGWLRADGAGIFLFDEENEKLLKLAALFNLPQQFMNLKIELGHGVIGTVAMAQETLFLENYRRDWVRGDDLPWASETFGSIIATPLHSANTNVGVLMVIAGRHGRLFNAHDVYVLELLSAQATVAISHSQLFEKQNRLTEEVEEAHNQLQTVLTSTDNPVIAINPAFEPIFINPSAQILLAENDDGPNTEAVLTAIFPKIFTSKQMNSFTHEISLQNRIYTCHLAMLDLQSTIGWVAVLNDITQLKELDHLKSEMIRMASHDLKNPLMGAMTNLELLQEDLRDAVTPDAQGLLTIIETQLERMNRIIHGVLDIERLEARPSTMGRCSADGIIENVLAELKPFVLKNDVPLIVNVAEHIPRFLGNQEQLERVFVNLIENAIKFTLGNQPVEFSTYLEGELIIFQIRDRGIGIPDTIKPRIFDRFFRGKQKGTEHISGSGLGLNLAKTVVENHNGEIWFVSEPSGGTSFFVSIPAYFSAETE